MRRRRIHARRTSRRAEAVACGGRQRPRGAFLRVGLASPKSVEHFGSEQRHTTSPASTTGHAGRRGAPSGQAG
eukprot:7381832-Prymnesium_polylepis.2